MGRVFNRRLSMTKSGVRQPQPFCWTQEGPERRFTCLAKFSITFNGNAYFLHEEVISCELELYTDATGAHGFGAVFGSLWMSDSW